MQSINRYEIGDNIGGLAKLNFIPTEDIIYIPPALDNEIYQDIQLQPGKTWYEAYFSLESLGYQETMQQTKHGEAFNMELKGFLPKNQPSLARVLGLMKRRKLVFAADDNNGQRLLIGSIEHYLRFERTLDTKDSTSGRNGIAVTFTGKSRHEAYFYSGKLPISESQLAERNRYLLLESGARIKL
ncbi:hypothetical protein [Xanthocytophaga agilis]|uniref:Uncharacterized protein n=1 Tax=Xanthocytophaga agilis TaxID=3048010 RepID=A0AAE3QYQ5_9BACT|nr:hypothetical protein [Xanthocytophaga agilis]MDJ1500481.1 hypothetical protein [Xanthocytophaga agilis]